MAYTQSLHSYSSLGCLDLHNLELLNADKSSSNYKMENNNNNSPCLMLPNMDNYSYNNNNNNNNYLSTTGYLEDALLEFSVRFKRRKLMVSSTINHEENHHDDPFSTQFTDDLSYWNSWLTNYSMHSDEELLSNHASFFADHNMNNYSSEIYVGENMEKSMKEMSEELNYYPDKTSTLLLEEIVVGANSPKPEELSSCSKDNSFKTKSTSFVYNNNDTYSTDSSSFSGGREMKKKNKVTTKSNIKTKMVYPFGLVKPGGGDGDITLNDINRRILMPPTRPLKHPVGDFAYRPTVSAHGPGLSGKAVVALTKIQTQGRGTITIIRTKG